MKRQLAAVMLILLLSSGIAVAQVTNSWEDDFEDGNADGWARDGGYDIQVVSESPLGQYSAYQETQEDLSTMRWTDGPQLDLQEEFTVTGTVRSEHPGDMNSMLSVRVGIQSQDVGAEGENAFLLFNDPDDATFLGTHSGETASEAGDTIDTAFQGQWVNFEITSDANNNTVRAKVWEYDSVEPEEYQLSREFEGVSGEFGVNVGTSEVRRAWLDQVSIEGQQVEGDADLELDVPQRVGPNETAEYRVYHWPDYVNENNTGNRVEVTENATVTSQKPSVLEVDQTAHTINATAQTGEVSLQASYNGSNDYQTVVVAPLDLGYIDILPPAYWVSTVLLNGNLQWVGMSLLLGVGFGLLSRNPWISLLSAEGTLFFGWALGGLNTGVLIASVLYVILASLTLLDVYRPRL